MVKLLHVNSDIEFAIITDTIDSNKSVVLELCSSQCQIAQGKRMSYFKIIQLFSIYFKHSEPHTPSDHEVCWGPPAQGTSSSILPLIAAWEPDVSLWAGVLGQTCVFWHACVHTYRYDIWYKYIIHCMFVTYTINHTHAERERERETENERDKEREREINR